MTAADIAFGRFVIWKGLRALIVDIQWRVHRTQVQIRVAGGHLHWVAPSELAAACALDPTMRASIATSDDASGAITTSDDASGAIASSGERGPQ
jgi:hypothetical protein